MQETILSLGALMIVMLIAINQQRSAIHAHERVYVREISQARDAFATSLLEEIVNTEDFDENTTTLSYIPPDASTMSSTMGPDAGESIRADFDDIDDYNGYSILDTTYVISADTFRFNVSFSVSYLDDFNNPTGTKTFTKEISATVDPVDNFNDTYLQALRGRISKTMIVSDSF